MDKEQIISFIKQNNGAEIAELQKKFDVSYKAVKDVIDWMVTVGDLVYAEGVKYNYIVKPVPPLREGRRVDFRRNAVEPLKKREDTANDETEEKPKYKSLREYFEMRRKEFEQRDEDEEEDDDDDDEEENNDDDSAEEEMEEEKLRQKALKLCIEKGTVSVSMFQRAFPIGYIRACNLVDWMEGQGYITPQDGFHPRKVLITEEDYENLYPHNLFNDDGDELDDDDESLPDLDSLLYSLDNKSAPKGAAINPEERKPAVQSLVNIFNAIAENKKAPVCAGLMPLHYLWKNETEFTETVMERMKRLIKSDKKMGKQGAVKKAEAYLDAVRDTHDGKMVQVYERLVYEIKNTSNYLYGKLKKQFSED